MEEFLCSATPIRQLRIAARVRHIVANERINHGLTFKEDVFRSRVSDTAGTISLRVHHRKFNRLRAIRRLKKRSVGQRGTILVVKAQGLRAIRRHVIVPFIRAPWGNVLAFSTAIALSHRTKRALSRVNGHGVQ